jgi:hypothetical protein
MMMTLTSDTTATTSCVVKFRLVEAARVGLLIEDRLPSRVSLLSLV